jgi:hypothetical protein
MAVRSKAQVRGSSTAGIAGSNASEVVGILLLCLLRVVASTCNCDELITHSEESYLICMCVSNSVCFLEI